MSDTNMPTGKIGNLTIGRLIIGGNQFSGWSHSRDLKYLRDLFKAYATPERVMQTLGLAEESGINTILSGDFLRAAPAWANWAAILACGLLVSALSAWRHAVQAGVLAVLAAAGFVAVNIWIVFRIMDVWVVMVAPLGRCTVTEAF